MIRKPLSKNNFGPSSIKVKPLQCKDGVQGVDGSNFRKVGPHTLNQVEGNFTLSVRFCR